LNDISNTAKKQYYSCGQITLDPSDFFNQQKQFKPMWKSPETANIQQKQQKILRIIGFSCLLISKLNFLPTSKFKVVQSYLSTAVR